MSRPQKPTLNYVKKNSGLNRSERKKQEKNEKKARKFYRKRFGKENDWSQLDTIYQDQLKIFEAFRTFANLIKENNYVRMQWLYPEEKKCLSQLMQILAADVPRVSAKLEEIRKEHANRKGPCYFDDFGTFFDIIGKYSGLAANNFAILDPLYRHVGEILIMAEDRMYYDQNKDEGDLSPPPSTPVNQDTGEQANV